MNKKFTLPISLVFAISLFSLLWVSCSNHERGSLFIVSAPAGTGKTTLVQRLTTENPNVVASISYTTRKPRGEEVDGKDYHFISKEQFEKMIADNQFLEYVKLYNYYYGTSKEQVNKELQKGHQVILVIDTQGALKLKDNKVNAKFIFIKPPEPAIEVLRERLSGRGTESKEVIEKRLAEADRELRAAKHYDYIIINDNLDDAYNSLRNIITK